MAIKDIPGITRMPKTERDWTKFVLDLSAALGTSGGTVSGDYVTLDTSQTITGAKDFSTAPTVNGKPVWHNVNVGEQINALPQDAVPDGAADYVVTFDVSDDTAKKVLLNDLPGGAGSSADDELLHWFFE